MDPNSRHGLACLEKLLFPNWDAVPPTKQNPEIDSAGAPASENEPAAWRGFQATGLFGVRPDLKDRASHVPAEGVGRAG